MTNIRKVTTSAAALSFSVMTLLLVSSVGSSQSRPAARSGDSPHSGKSRASKYAAASKNARKPKMSPDGTTMIMPMEYLGKSDPLSEIVKRQLPAVTDENGQFHEFEPIEVLKDVDEQKGRRSDLVQNAPNLQTETTTPLAAVRGTNFEGPGTGLAGFSLTGAPPDTTMAVGRTRIVSWVNSQYVIFDKSGNVLLGPVNANTLFTGTGNLCETTNRGDPILQYDRLADRWILSQFAFNVSGTTPASPYLQCIAVSTTNDPAGSYYRYSITFSSTTPSGFNDYGKLGVWTDAYYTAYNLFGGSPAGSNTAAGLCASDKTKMLNGDATATTLCQIGTFAGGTFGFLPADIDGTGLPTDDTRGGIFMRLSTATGQLRYMRLKANFTTSTSTLTDGFGGATGSFVALSPSAANLPCNGSGGTCIAQTGTTTKLDTLGDRLMYRLVYRNRGGVDSLIVTRSTDPDGAGAQNSAVAWYEIRNPLGNPSDANPALRPVLNQSAIFNPGAAGDRWMGSMAMDKFGNMLMGYSTVNTATSLKPSIAMAGRQAADALNVLQTEIIDTTGTGSQTVNSVGTALTRWGDYSTMQIDPADDTTFWYTTEYLSADGAFNWRTRITSYKFPITTTTAISDGNVDNPANWDNGSPTSLLNAVVPAGRTITVNTATSVNDLTVGAGATVNLNADLTVQGALSLGSVINAGTSTLELGCASTVSGASATTYVIGNVKKDFCGVGTFTFPTGTANGFSPVASNVTILGANPSSLTVKGNQGTLSGLTASSSLARFWDLTEAGDLTANLTFNYLAADVNGNQASYVVYKKVGAAAPADACNALSACTLGTNQISITNIADFSQWSAGQLVPTAAVVPISGRVVTSDGLGIRGAVVSITDLHGLQRNAITNAFGYYTFDGVQSGGSYVLRASARRYSFSPRVMNISDALAGIDFVDGQ